MKLGYINSRRPSKPNLPSVPKPSKLFAPTRLRQTFVFFNYSQSISCGPHHWALLSIGLSTNGPQQQSTSSLSCCVGHVLEFVHHQLVMYWELCIEMRDCRYNRSPIGYQGKGSTVCWYQIRGFLLLVIACFGKSGFSGVVALNSPSGFLSRQFSLFRNKSPISNLFFAAFNLVGDLSVLPRLLHVIEFN